MSLSRYAWMVSVALAACAAPMMHWEKPGASEAKVKEDSEECRVQVRLSPLPQQTVGSPSPSVAARVLSREEERALHDTENFQKCMRDKGYSAKR